MNQTAQRQAAGPRIGYLLYRYPRYSETFIVNEILALEAQGLPLSILAIRPAEDGIFHESISRVKAIANFVPSNTSKLLDRVEPELEKLAKNKPKALERAKALIDRYPDLTEDDLLNGAYVARWARKNQVDHLHVHFGKEAARVALIASSLSGLSWSMTLHAFDIFRDTVDLQLLGELMRSAALTITVSQYNRRYLLDAVPAIAPDRLIVHYNGIDTQRFTPAPAPREANTFLSVGRLIEKKGFCYLIEAAALLKQKGVSLHVTIIGDGKDRDALTQQIQKLDLQDTVTLAGPLPQHVVAQHMQKAACFVLPCVRAADGNIDALPTVLLEAMATECPVISTDLCGISEIISHEQDGLLVEPNHSQSLADAMHRVLTDRALTQSLGINARPKAIDRFNIETNGMQLAKRLLAAASNPTPPQLKEKLGV